MSVTVHFNDGEEAVVKTALANHEQGLREAKELTTVDPNIEDPELLTELVGQLDQELGYVSTIERKLNGQSG